MIHRTPTVQRGFTLVESLVALVVLSIGLLGIAALYLDSLRASRTALYRTQAVNLASDIAERIRANRDAFISYSVAFGEVPVATSGCETTASCTPQQLAETDVALWKAEIMGGGDVLGPLPQGDGQIIVTAGTPNVYEVTVRWVTPGEDEPATYSMRLEL